MLPRALRAARPRGLAVRPRGPPRRPFSARAPAAEFLKNEYSGRMTGEPGSVHTVPLLELEMGAQLLDAQCKYQTWGALNAARDNAVVVCHALTGNHQLDMWWGDLLGPGKALDTDKYFVVCMNTLGSCYGSCGPTSRDPRSADGAAYGPRFPADVTVRDAVELQAATLRDALGIREVACIIGGSMGGMISLEFCFRELAPLTRSAILLSTNGRHSAWQIATSELQRRAIRADPAFLGGEYERGAPPASGLGIARAIAMVSYRTHNAYETNFGRKVRELGAASCFQVASYLDYQGRKFVEQRGFDANAYLALTHMMDSHDVARGRGTFPQVLGAVAQPTLVAGITSDVLYPLVEQEELHAHLGNNVGGFHKIESDEGHDGFLLETERVSKLVSGFLAEHAPC